MIPQHYIDELLSRINIVDLIDKRVKLKKTGKNHSACCPFHDDKSPSFTVTEAEGFFYCFGCGAGGNGIGFVIRYENISFPEAVKKLAMEHGMAEPDKATRQQILNNEARKLMATLRDESLLIQIGRAMSARGEVISRDDRIRYEVAKGRVAEIKHKLGEMGYVA